MNNIEKDNAMEKAFKTKTCLTCDKKIWFWRKICHSCFLKAFNLFTNNL